MAENVEQSLFISFVNEPDYSCATIARKHPSKERVTSPEKLAIMS